MSDIISQIAEIRNRAKTSDGLKACKKTDAGEICFEFSGAKASYSLNGKTIEYTDLLKQLKMAKDLTGLLQPPTR